MTKLNVHSPLKDICHSIEEKALCIDGLKAVLKQKILALPDNNKDINWISKKPRCFTVSSSALAKGQNWTPGYQDFPAQYELIADYVTSVSHPYNILARVHEVIERQRVPLKGGGTQQLHPKVVENLQKLLGEENGS